MLHRHLGALRRSILPSFNASRHRLWIENAAFAASVPEGARVLDAGAGRAPYRSLFAHARYESADFEQVDKVYAPSTYVCDLSEIPVEDGRFGYVVFNQVMEHLPEPLTVLEELHRVLEPGGRMIYSGPLFYQEHEQPYDFYRYTQYGLRHLFGRAGFEIELSLASDRPPGSDPARQRRLGGLPLRRRSPRRLVRPARGGRR